jgi:hypothetical protein
MPPRAAYLHPNGLPAHAETVGKSLEGHGMHLAGEKPAVEL